MTLRTLPPTPSDPPQEARRGFCSGKNRKSVFSNDQNVETIAQLIEVIKHYIGLQSEYVKLDVIDKVVRLLTMLVLIAVFGILLVIAIIYFSFAAAYALSDAIGSLPGAFAIVGAFYLVVLFVFIRLRMTIIERPLVHFLASILMSK